jgi:hypothetical protein
MLRAMHRAPLLSIVVFALAALATPAGAQLSCPNCLHRGVLACKEHLEVPIEEEMPSEENPIAYCSWAANCPKCAGTLWVDCPRCDFGERTKEVEERGRVIRSWMETSTLERALARSVPRLETRRFALVLDVESLPDDDKGKKRSSGHVLAHKLARDLEWVAARVAEHYQMTEPDYRAKMRLWLWPTLAAHQKAQEHFQGTLTTGDFKLLGRDPVLSVWTEPPHFDTAPKVRALFVHNAAHMLLSNAFRPEWVGDIGGGWLDAGLGHWYEYAYFGLTVNYCTEESSLADGYEGGRWRAPVRRRLEKEKDPFLPTLFGKRTGQMSTAEHALCWSFYDYLLAAHPGAVRKLLIDLKQKKSARDVLKEHTGLDLFAAEEAWRAWVSENYPLKGDEPKRSADKKDKKK